MLFRSYNKAHGITPKTVIKDVRDVIEIGASEEDTRHKRKGTGIDGVEDTAPSKKRKLTAKDREAMIEKLTREMKQAAKDLEFEKAAFLRDEIARLKSGK